MEFTRSDLGIENTDLFYLPKITVFVEGVTDFPFYDEILKTYNIEMVELKAKNEGKKLISSIVEKDLPFVVVLDGDYEILERRRSQHRRVILLHRYSFENYLFEVEAISQFCGDLTTSEGSSDENLTTKEFTDFIQVIEKKFKELLIYDVAHQRAKTGQKTFFRDPERFYKKNFKDDQIDKQVVDAAFKIDHVQLKEARKLVEKFLRKSRFIYLLRGSFAFSIMRNFIINKVGKSVKNDEMRLYLSRMVWGLVNSRDHKSLKRRLREAVREADRLLSKNTQTVLL